MAQIAPWALFQFDNHLGTACVETDHTGAVISYEEYHPYGTSSYRSWDINAEVSAKRYRYTGKERDEETSLYYHGARYYAPWLGRWMSADPAGTVDGSNLFAYVRGSPVVLSDPSGTQSQQPIVVKTSVRPEGVPGNVSRWTYGAGGQRLVSSEAEFNKAAAGASVIYQYDPDAAALETGPGTEFAAPLLGEPAASGGSSSAAGSAGGGQKATGLEKAAAQAALAGSLISGDVKDIPEEGAKPGGHPFGMNKEAEGNALIAGGVGLFQVVATVLDLGPKAFGYALKKAGQLAGDIKALVKGLDVSDVDPNVTGLGKQFEEIGSAGKLPDVDQPDLGRKLEYLYGNATGRAHNITRSQDMLCQLNSIGLDDTPGNRAIVSEHLSDVYKDASTITKVQDNGRVVRESLLMGPKGGLKLESIWDGPKLITVKIFGGKVSKAKM